MPVFSVRPDMFDNPELFLFSLKPPNLNSRSRSSTRSSSTSASFASLASCIQSSVADMPVKPVKPVAVDWRRFDFFDLKTFKRPRTVPFFISAPSKSGFFLISIPSNSSFNNFISVCAWDSISASLL